MKLVSAHTKSTNLISMLLVQPQEQVCWYLEHRAILTDKDEIIFSYINSCQKKEHINM